MPLPIDHRVFWPPQKYSADQRWDEDRAMGVQGDRPPYLRPGSFYVYFSRSDTGPSGGVYNLFSDQADLVIERLKKDRALPFEALVEGVVGAGFAYRNEDIQYVAEQS